MCVSLSMSCSLGTRQGNTQKLKNMISSYEYYVTNWSIGILKKSY